MVLLSAFLLGIFIMQKEIDFRDAYMSKMIDGSRVTIWGELIKLETTDYGKRGILSDCYIDFGEGVVPCNDILVYMSSDLYQMGQIHKINGKVNMFSRARNEGNFDSFVYYQSLKIDFAVEAESSVLLGNEQGVGEEFLLSLREKMAKVYKNNLSEKASGFYQAMVLGNKIDLDETLKQLFLVGGLSHILAISGLHVFIIGRGVYALLRRMGISFASAGILGACLLVSYSTMVGGGVSTIRAVGMMLLYFLAQWMGRSYDMLNALGAMVLFLLAENPFLIENSGFWFSVTALLGVGAVSRLFVDEKESKTKLSFSGFGVSIAITLATLPITALSYYEIPLYSPLVNFLVLPLLTPVFCLAVICGVIGATFPEMELVTLLLQPCEWLLGFYETVCIFVEHLPGAKLICGCPSGWQVMVYYIALFGGTYAVNRMKIRKDKGKRHLRIAILILCMGCLFFPKTKPFEITFLDVGQGDGIYICDGEGTSLFIDGGSSNVNEVGENRILPFLKSKAVRSIDYWFVSHADTDHVSGLYGALESGYEIKYLVLHELCRQDDKYDNLRFAAREAGTKVCYMQTGDQIVSKRIKMQCIGPLIENGVGIGKDKNENSMILLVEEKEKRFTALFAGDISTEIESVLCKEELLFDVDLFKANHHGSNYSNSAKLLETICPEYIVVSCSKKNLYGHPGERAVERMEDCGAEIFYTMENGQITFPLIQ